MCVCVCLVRLQTSTLFCLPHWGNNKYTHLLCCCVCADRSCGLGGAVEHHEEVWSVGSPILHSFIVSTAHQSHLQGAPYTIVRLSHERRMLTWCHRTVRRCSGVWNVVDKLPNKLWLMEASSSVAHREGSRNISKASGFHFGSAGHSGWHQGGQET